MDYSPLPFLVFDAQGEVSEPGRPWEVWEVCLRDAAVAPVGWSAQGVPAVPGCPFSLVCDCKRASVGALAFLLSRHRSAEAAHAACEVLLADWNDPRERAHRAVLDALIAKRLRERLASVEARKRDFVLARQRVHSPARVAMPGPRLFDDDVPF